MENSNFDEGRKLPHFQTEPGLPEPGYMRYPGGRDFYEKLDKILYVKKGLISAIFLHFCFGLKYIVFAVAF
jgi:hypothetical protein